jgi:hypothetical protein
MLFTKSLRKGSSSRASSMSTCQGLVIHVTNIGHWPMTLYENMVHNEWVEWWLQTNYGRKSKINWDSTHHTPIWEKFDQVASIQDGAPKIMCRRCAKILEHPYSLRTNTNGRSQYHGTSGMSKHRNSHACIKCEVRQKTESTQFLKTATAVSRLRQDP